MKIDFHTHHPQKNGDGLNLYCHTDLKAELPHIVLERRSPICAGLHPWFLPQSWKEGRELLDKWREHPQFIGLGECGLDGLKGADQQKQRDFFFAQLEWARSHTIPFIVLHSVRTGEECYRGVKKSGFKGKIIFHDYKGGAEQTTRLLQDPQVFLSLGRALDGLGKFTKELHLLKREILTKRLFLETDEGPESISNRYRQLSTLLKRGEEELEKEIEQNFFELTSTKLTP